MSAFKWFAFAIGVPLCALLIGFGAEISYPMIEFANAVSTSDASSTGITWYEQVVTWLPFIVLSLLGFMVLVAVVVRRTRVARL